jgi:hypothetical protein
MHLRTKCLECHRSFEFKRRPGRRPGFCDEECRREWHRKMSLKSWDRRKAGKILRQIEDEK